MFKKFIIFYELFIIFLKESFINSKIIILKINKVSFQDIVGENKIDDFINYDIYTEIKVGTPPQKVTHFIVPNDKIFQFKNLDINYNTHKFNNSIKQFLDNQLFLFNSYKSTSYKGSFSDNFIFDINDKEEKIEVKNLNFTIYYNNRNNDKKYGIIGFQTMYESDEIKIEFIFKELYSFISQLKKLNIITDYSFFFKYNDNNIFESSISLGKIIIGEYPHQLKENKNYNKDEEIKIYSSSNSFWSLSSDEIIFGDYIKTNIRLEFDFNSKFIKGTNDLNDKLKMIFFDELIEQKLCKNEIISENKGIFPYEIYSCINNEIINEKIKQLPTLNFVDKRSNITFKFDFNDLFQLFPDKNIFYFMIIFRLKKYVFLSDTWTVGEIFLKKYLGTFNLESKTISFYKSQFHKENNNIINIDNNKKLSGNIRIFIEIFMGILIIFSFYLLYRKYKKTRKLLANELEDSDYTYISHEQKSETISEEK